MIIEYTYKIFHINRLEFECKQFPVFTFSSFSAIFRNKNIFPNAWGKLPKNSRLMHGAGIWAMIHLADHVARSYGRWFAEEEVIKDQEAIKDYLAWTDGKWENIDGVGNDMKWNDIQNTAAHKKLLTNYIIRKWEMTRGGKLRR